MNKHVCTRWAFDLATWTPTLTQLSQAVAIVQPEERTRLMKFVFMEDFLSSLVGRLLMRKYVSASSGQSYDELQFERDVRGKPYWALNDEQTLLPPLSFNVSHQGSLVVLAGVMQQSVDSTSHDFGVGVDVMEIDYSGGKSLNEFFRLMNRKFSDNEWQYISRPQHNELARLKAFMRHWCLKEAYVKELGVGITVDLRAINFTVDPTQLLDSEALLPLTSTKLHCNDVPMTSWHFEEHLLQPQYCAAIAFRNCKPAPANFEWLQLSDLLVKSDKAQQDDILEYCRNVLKKQRRTPF